MNRRALSTILAVSGLMGAGCTNKTTGVTPNAPTPPQVTVAQLAQLATAAGDTAAHELVALCNSTPAQLDGPTCNKAKTVLLTVKTFVDGSLAEANKVPAVESWGAARANIAALGATVAVNAATGSTVLDGDIAALLAFVKQIEGVQ